MTNSVWQAPIQNATGDIVIGAEITVIDESTGLDATIFSTRAGAALTNPFFSDANGFAQFYAGPGEYRIQALDNGTGLTQILRYVRLGDAGSVDTGTSKGQIPLSEDLNMNSGETNYTSGNIQPEIFDGELTKGLMRNISGGAHGNNASFPGSQLELCRFTSAGAIQQIAGSPSGTWKNVNNGQIASNEYGMYVRIA